MDNAVYTVTPVLLRGTDKVIKIMFPAPLHIPVSTGVGPQGPKGDTGYSPVRGVDYWTAADQQAVIDAVLAAYPAAESESF